MDEQQSQKRGVRSEGQKTERARDGYEPIPPAKPVAGAFGDHHGETPADEEPGLRLGAKDKPENRRDE